MDSLFYTNEEGNDIEKRVHIESFGKQAENRLQTLIEKAKATDPLAPVTVIVTSQYAGLSLRRSLAAKNGLINVRFMVLSRLAEYVGSPSLSATGKTRLNPLFELAAIQQTAALFKGKSPLGDIADNPKLHQSLVKTFSELEYLTPEGIKQISRYDCLREQMVDWYRQTRNILKNYYTQEDLCKAAARALSTDTVTSVLTDLGFVIFFLIQDFSPNEAQLAVTLYQIGSAAVVFGITGEAEIDQQFEPMIRKFESGFQKQTSSVLSDHNIEHILIAHNYQEEVKWIVRQAIFQAEKRSVPFHRMAVLYHDPFPYAEFIQQQLLSAGAPVAGPSKTLIKNTPPGKLVTHFLEVIQSDLSRDALMQWIAESPVRNAVTGTLAWEELTRWEIISQNAGIVKGSDQWRWRLKAYRDSISRKIKVEDNSEETTAPEFKGFQQELVSLNSLADLINRLSKVMVPPDGSPYALFADWIKIILQEFAYDPASWPEEGQKAFEKIKEILVGISNLDKIFPKGTTFKGFTDLLGIALETSVGRVGPTGEGVFIATISAAAGMNFEIVFITGMSEGAFPPRPSVDALLPDAVRILMTGKDKLPLSVERKLDERRRYLAAKAAGHKCFLSFCRTDANAERGQYPSPWLLDEISKLNGKPVGSAEIENLGNKPWLSIVYSTEHALGVEGFYPADIHDYDMASLSCWKANHRTIQDHFLLAKTTPAGQALSMESAHQSTVFSVWDGNLTSIAKKSLSLKLPGNDHFSPTRLERWAGCPLSYFFGYVLEIPVYEKPEEIITISAMDRGSLVHHILERFITTLMGKKELPDYGEVWTDRNEQLLIEIAHEEFANTEKKGITGHPLMWQMVREEIEQDLVAFLDADNTLRRITGLKTIHVEKGFGFGKEGNLPSVVVKAGSKEISLHGLIDRVDSNRSGDQIYIIDYKTGGASAYSGMKKDPLECGKRLQLPVYSLAVRNILNNPVNIKACYWFISSKGNFERREVELSAVEEKFIEDLEIIVSGIEGGLYPANPGKDEKENCRFCDYERICATDRDLMWKRKDSAPELRAYLKLINNQPDEEETE